MIPVAEPYIAPKSADYISKALEKGAISGLYGDELPEFEAQFADFIGVKNAIACSSGTAALHLSLAAYGIGAGDEVLVASLTNMATFFAVLYCGAKPIPVDVEIDTYTISIDDLKKKISPRTKGIMVVHLFGQPCDMESVNAVASVHGIPVFEDCAESHGATILGKQTGSLGYAGGFSFFANKNISTGEGGMVTSDDDEFARKVKTMKSLWFGEKDKFLHEGVGFNYRMDNLKAALGKAQMEVSGELINSKIKMGDYYSKLLEEDERLRLPISREGFENVYWMYHVGVRQDLIPNRAAIMNYLHEHGIETRPGFVSFTLQKFCEPALSEKYPCPNAESVSYSTFYLPSSHFINEETQEIVAAQLRKALDKYCG